MPTLRQSVQIAQNLPSISADGYEPIAITSDFVVPTGLVASDVIEMGVLPAGYAPLGAKLLADDLDSNASPTITFDCGVITGTSYKVDNTRTCGNEAFAASTVGQAGGIQLDNKADFGFLAVDPVNDRSIGLKVVTGAATLTVGARLRLVITARPALNGV